MRAPIGIMGMKTRGTNRVATRRRSPGVSALFFSAIFVAPLNAADLVGARIGVHEDKTRLVLTLSDIAPFAITQNQSGDAFGVTLVGVSVSKALTQTHSAGAISAIDIEPLDSGQGLQAQITLHEPSAVRESFILPPSKDSSAHRLVIDFAATPQPTSAPETQFPLRITRKRVTTLQPADPYAEKKTRCENGADNAQLEASSRHAKHRCVEAPTVSFRGDYGAEVHFAAPGFSISQTYRAGADTVFGRKHIFASTLSAANSWRSEVDARANIFDRSSNTIDISFGLFDSRQPLVFTRGGLGVDDFERWRENSIADLGFTYAGLNDRVKVTAGAAYSESAMRIHRSDDPSLWIYDAENLQRSYLRRDNAYYQSISADIIKNKEFSGSFSLSHVATGQDFRTFQTNTLQDIYYEGRTTDFATEWRAGKSKYNYKKTAHNDAYYAFNTDSGSVERGAVKLNFSRRRERIEDGGFVFAHDETVAARANLSLKAGTSGLSRAIPDTLSFGYSQRRAVEPTLLSSDSAIRRTFGAGLSKAGDHYSTDIYLYWKERDDFSPGAGPFGASEWGVDFNQSVYFDNWDFSFYVLMSDERRRRNFGPDGRDRAISAGASFSKQFENLPPIKFSLDLFESDFRSQFDEFKFQSNDFSVRAETILSETIFSGRERGVLRSDKKQLDLFLGAYYGASLFDSNEFGRESDSETRILLMLRTN